MSDRAPNSDHLPAPACVATPEVNEQLREIRATQQEIRTALIGNPALGHKGLVHRVEFIETRVEAHDRKLLVWGTTITAGVTLAVTALQFLKEKLLRS